MISRLGFLALLLPICAASALAGTWERFRGPDGSGVANNQNLPIEFGDSNNLAWKVAVPGLGNSSPVVWNDQVFVQTATPAERILLCLDAKTGQKIWEKKSQGTKGKTHPMNTMASATPACDGTVVVIATWDGTEVVLSALNMKGEPMWEKNLGEFKSQHGPGGSPIIYRDKVFFNFDSDEKAFLTAFDKETGKPLWTQPREKFRASYSAPQMLEKGANGTELLVTTTTAITSYNPDTGSRNWNWTWKWPANTKPLRTVASSVVQDGQMFAFSGDGGGDRQMASLQLPTAQGGTPTTVWESPKKDFPYVPCPLVRDGRLYTINDRAFAGCYDGKTGKQIFYERLPGSASVTASPILVDGKIYAGSEEGEMYVLAAEPKFEILARNKIGERLRATPAVADGRLYVRGADHLFCFAKTK